MFRVISILILTFVAALAHASLIPFELRTFPDGSSIMQVKATFDQVTADCLLDSGARISTVDQTPNFTKYTAIDTDTATGVTGNQVPVDLIKINNIKIGGDELQNWTVRRQPKLAVPCVVGNDILQTKSLYYDFQNEEIDTRATLPAASSSHPLQKYNGKWIGFPVEITGQSYESFWDTGAGLTTVDTQVVDAHPEVFTYVTEIPIADATGEGKAAAKIYKLKSLHFGDIEVRDILVIALSLEAIRKEVPNIYAVFGINVIKQFNWYIDNVHNQWSAKPVPVAPATRDWHI